MHLRDLVLKIIFGVLIIMVLVTNSYATEEKSPKQILILASYNPGLKWTDSIGSEIENQLSIYYPTAQFIFEYMDTKKQAPSKTRLAELKEAYLNKYKDSHFDVIICSDDDAFQFLLNNRDELFPGTPVVFCGVNFFEDKMLAGEKGFTGVVEAFDLPNTISLMLKLHPKTNQIVIVNDQTTTGKANREVMNQTLPSFSENVSFAVWDNMTVEEMQRNASALQDGSLILLLNYNRDREGRTLTHEESAWTLRSASSVPIYGTRDVYMGFGVLGGMITAGPVQGSLAADLALRILMGEPANKIPVIKTPFNYYMFDTLELRRFNISLSSLPSDSIFVNQPLHSRVDLSDRNLSGLDLSGTNLSNSDLHGSDLRGTNLSRSFLIQDVISNAKLIGANLSGAFMPAADLHGSDLSRADLRDAYMPINYLIYSNLTGADLSGTYMDQSMVDNSTLVDAKLNGASLWAVKISYANLTRASFVKALMNRATFQNSQLDGANLTRASLIGTNLINATVTSADLTGADISEARCGGANFSGSKLVKSTLGFTNLTSTNLSRSDLSDSYLVASNLDDSDLTKAILSGANLENAFMRRVKLVEAKLPDASLNGARLDDSDLSRSDLKGTDLTGASLTGSNLTGADLSDARLVGTDLTLAVISGATLSRTSLVGSKLNWAKLSGSSFTDCQFARAEFFGADLSNSDLSNSDFTRAYLTRANLSGSKMENTVLDHTDLTNANLSNADFSNADLENVYLDDANMSSANVAGAHMEAFDQKRTIWRKANLRSVTMKTGTIVNDDFSGADLRNAHFVQVYINNTNFSGANLSAAVFEKTAFENVDFSGADLREIKYDMVAIQFFAASKLDGAQMSPDLQQDLERLRSGQTNFIKAGASGTETASDNITDSSKDEPKLEIKSVGTGVVVSGGSAYNKTKLNVVLLDFGPIGDHGWTYEAHVGAARMEEKLPYVNLSERENAAGANASQIMREYAKMGADLIFCHSLAFEDAIKEVAPEYPNTIFMLGGGTKKLAPNVGTYYCRIYEAQYLAGIVAGNMTKTDKIAFPAALPDPEVVIGIDAFAKGVASTNPDAKVYVEWIGNWYDPEKERMVATSLIDKGCDVITYWSDSDATGEVAEKTGTYFISFGSDLKRFTSHVFLTGVKWNWEPEMTDIVESVHNGTWNSHPKQDWWYGLAEGGVELVPFSYLVPDDIQNFVAEKQKAIAYGEIEVFPGKSDEELQEIYYFEPNVVGDLPKRG